MVYYENRQSFLTIVSANKILFKKVIIIVNRQLFRHDLTLLYRTSVRRRACNYQRICYIHTRICIYSCTYVHAEFGIWMMTFVTDILKITYKISIIDHPIHPVTNILHKSFKRHGLVNFRNMHTCVCA